jgi:hypothetical protein
MTRSEGLRMIKRMRLTFANVARGFSLVHDPEGSHYKNVEYLRQPG